MKHQAEPPKSAPLVRGRLIEIPAGRRLRVVSEGPLGPGPAVWCEAGAFGDASDWAAVQALLAARGVRSHAYDRAGLGGSDPAPGPRDARAIAADLEALIAAAGEAGPFVLVGHSFAGLLLRVFAAAQPAQVAGLVLVDALNPNADPARMRYASGAFSQLARVTAHVSGAGLLRAFEGFADPIGLPAPAKADKRRSFFSPSHTAGAALEAASMARSFAQARDAAPYDAAWPAARVDVRRLSAARRAALGKTEPAADFLHVEEVPGATHANLLGERFAQHVAAAIMIVIEVRARRAHASA